MGIRGLLSYVLERREEVADTCDLVSVLSFLFHTLAFPCLQVCLISWVGFVHSEIFFAFQVEEARCRGGIELLVDFYCFEHLLLNKFWKSLSGCVCAVCVCVCVCAV